jgi:hypothetical protein
MPRFKHYNYDQDAVAVINYQEQLQPGTFEHAVHYLIEQSLNLRVFHPKYRFSLRGQKGTGPVAVVLPGAQHGEVGELRAVSGMKPGLGYGQI